MSGYREDVPTGPAGHATGFRLVLGDAHLDRVETPLPDEHGKHATKELRAFQYDVCRDVDDPFRTPRCRRVRSTGSPLMTLPYVMRGRKG